MRGMIKTATILIVTTLVLMAFVQKVSSPEPEIQQVPVISLTLYFATPDAVSIRPEQREVPQTSEPARLAMEELLAGTHSQDLVTVIPTGTKLKGFSIRDGVAYVDVSSDILKTPNRGSASETLVIASIVNTLTEFPGIQRVQILVEGKEQETLYGHMDLSEPFTRFKELSLAGAIV